MKQPAFFQGRHKTRRYFEGWYFKCISADRKTAIAIIPGMAIDPQGLKHAFIQVINAVTGSTRYFHFPFESFAAATDRFHVTIDENVFSAEGLQLDIQSPEGQVLGALTFSHIHSFPVTRFNPGIMGPYSFVPFMECYHAIINLGHQMQGQIELDGERMDFTGGTGYIEKDYGRSFPSTYTWIQAGHFDTTDASFVFSRARIPFLGREFPGFFAYLTDFKGLSLRFATYNHSRLENWQVDPVAGTCSGRLSNRSGTLEFSAKMSGGGKLRAPVDGLMDREIIESISARVAVTLKNPDGKLMFQATSSEAGMEISM